MSAPINAVTANLNRLEIVPWLARRGKVAELINRGQPDWLAMQECPEREDWIAGNLAGPYAVVSDHINCVILVRSDRWRVVDSRPFTLYGKTRKRYAAGAIVEDVTTRQQFAVVSAHLSSNKEATATTDRPRQAEELWARLDAWGATTRPLMLLGDWNDWARATVPGVARIMWTHGLVDALDAVPAKAFTNRNYPSATGWRTPKPGSSPKHIDRAFANAGLRFESAELILTGIYADHNFIRYTAAPTGQPIPPVEQKTTPEAAKLIKSHPPIKVMDLSKLNAAMRGGYPSRYVHRLQLWLGRPSLTGRWSAADQVAYEGFRAANGYTIGIAAGVGSVQTLANRAAQLNNQPLKVVA